MLYLKKKFFPLTLLMVALLAYSPAVKAEDIDDSDIAEVSDPLETVNRTIYAFNHAVDVVFLKPVAKGYRFIVPSLVRQGVRNVVNNLGEPVIVFNSALQGDKQQGFTSFWRFTINSTWGLGGIFDVATQAGLQYRKEDFGQTQGVYGVGQGFYVMLPILGPSNARDTVGLVVDVAMDPFTYIFQDEVKYIEAGIAGLDRREGTLDLIENIESTSLDPYATIRSLYTQKRWDDIKNGKRL